MKDFLKKLFLNSEGNVSWMKLGGAIIALAGAVASLPAVPGVVIPLAVTGWAKIIVLIGAGIGVAGARDAMDSKK